MTPNGSAQERNVALIRWWIATTAMHAWMPVFFLYFASHVSIATVLLLEAVYYATVVLLEVPSGYFSDRIGRRPTLIAASCALLASYVTFAAATGVVGLAMGQVLLATGLAFASGTDTSLHYDTLAGLGRADEYGDREASNGRLAFATSALAAVVGGAVAMIDLRLAYVVSAVAAIVGLSLAFRMVEPTVRDGRAAPVGGFAGALRACASLARGRALRWLLLSSVVATVANHLPYEFYQPWLERADASLWSDRSLPLVAGLHVALVQAIAAPVAGLSVVLARRLGLRLHLLLSHAVQCVIVIVMAITFHPLIALLIAARSVPRGLQDAPTRAAISPRVGPALRATWYSLQSLLGRLGFALALVVLSVASASAADALTTALAAAAVLVVVGWLVLAAVPSGSLESAPGQGVEGA